jgi:hypothetical protein
MEKLEWHISNLCFCNGIFTKCESCSGIDPINPTKYPYALQQQLGTRPWGPGKITPPEKSLMPDYRPLQVHNSKDFLKQEYSITRKNRPIAG